ncbi:hypothetical protein D4765_16815 [Subtercola vilae]|uniref:DNA modification methylase n=1 Tax=Subtercola vilae TaxID=2056433 RepID=A0A4T2BIP3_9MICO|nr:hypothetical protein D4765_16815 [Subtercola vilae]
MAALIGVSASGCAFITPQSTISIKEAADGVEGNVSPDLAIRNATLISDDNKTGSLIASFVNTSSSPITVNMQYTDSSGVLSTETQYVEGSSTSTVGGTTDVKVVFTGLDVKAGALFPVFFQYGTQTGVKLLVPVLTSDWPQFTGLAPTVAPTATALPTPSASATVAPQTATPAPAATPAQ